MLTALTFLLGLVAPAQTADPQPAPTPTPVAAKAEKKICRSEVALGSTLQKRTCRTRAEWALQRRLEQQELERVGGLDRARQGALRASD